MIRNQIFANSKLVARRNVRYNSNQTTVSKATSLVSTLTSKAAGVVNSTIYWTKVTAELAKHIYVKEGLAPPSGAQLKSVYQSLWQQGLVQARKYAQQPTLLRESVTSITRNDVIKGGAYAVQFFGLFALGEIIGRRNVFGYPDHHIKHQQSEATAEH
jgi:F-type H+-transporting ATPase subunit g